MWNFPLFPQQASTHAAGIDALYAALWGMTLFFAGLICVLILFLAIRYRRGSRADRTNPVTQNHALEAFWIITPFLISMGLFGWASRLYFDLYNPPEDAFEVSVVGKQWMWYLQHPEGKSEINELHVPVGRAVKLTMISQDVIHSFYVPAFRVKQDVLPGRYTSEWFRPTKTGRYRLFCAEYCGTNHSRMIGHVTVMEPSEYEQWLESGRGGESMAEAGARLFQQYHCSGCHGANSSFRAPKLEGVYGHQVPVFEGGAKEPRFVTADDRYIRDSILLPKSQVVAGFEPIMPSYQGQIGEADLLKILDYIKSLGEERGAGR